jgi:hypothetical protein
LDLRRFLTVSPFSFSAKWLTRVKKAVLLKNLNKFKKKSMLYLRTLILFVICTPTFAFTQVGIGTSTPNASAQLDVTSTSKGFLPPRMTSAQRDAIASPAEGLLIFNTTNKSIEVYISGASGGESFLSGFEYCSIGVGGYYFSNQWWNETRGMAQSFVSGGGNLSSITIKVGSVVPESTSTLYELNVYNGSPSGCGNNGSTCALSDLGTPIATCQVSINSSGEKTLNLQSPVYLSSNQTYTFSITPTVSTQGFSWSCYSTGYSSGASFGISGNVSGATDDLKFQTNYITGWRSLKFN